MWKSPNHRPHDIEPLVPAISGVNLITGKFFPATISSFVAEEPVTLTEIVFFAAKPTDKVVEAVNEAVV